MKKTILSIAVSFFILSGFKSFAQIYISFDGIKGESAFKAFPLSTEINSLSWGAKSATTLSGGGGASVGKVQVNELIFTKPRGSISQVLQMNVFIGKNIPKAEIRFYRSGSANPVPYLTITLENVLITNWSISGEARDIPMESFSLVFTKFKTEDAAMKADGSMEKIPGVGWDIQKNSAY